MNIVLDTSAAVRVVLDRDIHLIKILQQAEHIFVPHLFFAEVGNVFLKYYQFQNMHPEACKLYMMQCRQLITDVVDEYTFNEEVFDIATKNQLSFYDAIYLAMAKKLAANLLTEDKKLNDVASKLGLVAKEV
ncbi:MAG: type II toxin-antitoxin system VapC family toxin [Chitinophagales bacterium]|nr:type II toxin-antitoxin system VapC family toxin [Chitinophagales bacterium]